MRIFITLFRRSSYVTRFCLLLRFQTFETFNPEHTVSFPSAPLLSLSCLSFHESSFFLLLFLPSCITWLREWENGERKRYVIPPAWQQGRQRFKHKKKKRSRRKERLLTYIACVSMWALKWNGVEKRRNWEKGYAKKRSARQRLHDSNERYEQKRRRRKREFRSLKGRKNYLSLLSILQSPARPDVWY